MEPIVKEIAEVLFKTDAEKTAFQLGYQFGEDKKLMVAAMTAVANNHRREVIQEKPTDSLFETIGNIVKTDAKIRLGIDLDNPLPRTPTDDEVYDVEHEEPPKHNDE